MTHFFFLRYCKEFIWVFPFLCFLLGYHCLNVCFRQTATKTPCVVGKTLPEALHILAENNLNMRMISEHEDADIPTETIINQTPQPGNSIREQQTVFLIISKKPPKPVAPNLCNQHNNQYSKILSESKIRYRTFGLNSTKSEGICIGQIPEEGKEIPEGGMVLYTAIPSSIHVILPSFKGKAVKDVQAFLKKYNISVQLFHTSEVGNAHTCNNCIVKEQKPLPGSFVSLKEPFCVQLKS